MASEVKHVDFRGAQSRMRSEPLRAVMIIDSLPADTMRSVPEFSFGKGLGYLGYLGVGDWAVDWNPLRFAIEGI